MGDANDGQPGAPPDPVELGLTWFLAARAMVAARGVPPADGDASAGLYAQAILGLSEATCLEAKQPERIGSRSLVDCLAGVGRLSSDLAEKIVVGVMMIAYSDRAMHPLEVRWASMVTSAARLTHEDFQRCCASARVIAAMLRPAGEGAP
ncbi:MAG: hypothetical protein ACYTG1_00880 [Planctomycetota bacterium]|jgi:hypothetical protein